MNPKKIFRLNTVFRVARTNGGNIIGVILKSFDGTIEDSLRVAKEISIDMFSKYPDASNIQSLIGIADRNGIIKCIISPNFKIVTDVNTKLGEQSLRELFDVIGEHCFLSVF